MNLYKFNQLPFKHKAQFTWGFTQEQTNKIKNHEKSYTNYFRYSDFRGD